jgi:uncharacterized protein (TIGR03067 family)
MPQHPRRRSEALRDSPIAKPRFAIQFRRASTPKLSSMSTLISSWSSRTHRIALLLAVATGLTLSLTARAADDGFVSLFDGRTLEGWEGNPALWSVRDGAITGQTSPELPLKHNTFLVWKGGTVEDFELRLSYRIVHGNSGIQYRSKVLEQGAQGPIVGGYQADFEAGTTYSGILYEERGRGILAQRGQMTRIVPADGGKHDVEVLGSLGDSEGIQKGIRSEDWNEYIVIARGNHFTHIINGRVTVDVTDDDPAHGAKSGVLALQIHVGPPMTVQFKDIRIRKDTTSGETASSKTDLEGIQGKWLATSARANGEDIPPQEVAKLQLTFKGSKYVVDWESGGDTGSIQLTETSTPKGMLIVRDENGETLNGIYELKGHNLRVAYTMGGGPAPKDFSSPADSRTFSVTYSRK